MRLASLFVLPLAMALSSGCSSRSAEDRVRLGVDRSLSEVGLPELLRATFEEKTKLRVEVIEAAATELVQRASRGELDQLLLGSGSVAAELEAQGLASRSAVIAHEELVMIGPFEDLLGHHGDVAGKDLLRNIARTNYRYLKARPGSAERLHHDALFAAGGDRAEPGAFFETSLEGTDLAKKAIETRAFALVRRSSLMRAGLEGRFPHRIYKEGDPALVLRLVMLEVHPKRTGRVGKEVLYDWVVGPEGAAIVARFGAQAFGVPVYGVGDPGEGRGAELTGLEALPGAQPGGPE